jgi:hypothetical protein
MRKKTLLVTSNVIVPKKAPPDGTSGGVTVKMDMGGLKSLTVRDALPTEDDNELVAFFMKQNVLRPNTLFNFIA